MAFMTVNELLGRTDRLAGIYAALATALPAVQAKMQADITAIYGDGTAANLPLSDPGAIDALGPPARRSLVNAGTSAPYALLLAADVAALSSYLQQSGGAAAGLPPAVRDAASYLRSANGCPDPSPQGGGAGSSYAKLAHPLYAALVSLLTGGGSALPPDVVFAPQGLVLGRFHLSGGYAAGQAVMSAPAASFAPVQGQHFVVRAGNAAALAAPAPGQAASLTGAVPNGSLFLVVTGTNHLGNSVTWRGDAGTGLVNLGDTLPASALQGTAGGANGGTAAASHRLTAITGIALDSSRTSSATAGDIDLIAVAERGVL